MELRQIEYFLVACETLNFTGAAKNCNVAVPTLTRAIKALEEELGGQLFRRERHLTHLTDLGRFLTVAGRPHTPAVAQVVKIAQAIDWYAESDVVPSS